MNFLVVQKQSVQKVLVNSIKCRRRKLSRINQSKSLSSLRNLEQNIACFNIKNSTKCQNACQRQSNSCTQILLVVGSKCQNLVTFQKGWVRASNGACDAGQSFQLHEVPVSFPIFQLTKKDKLIFCTQVKSEPSQPFK